MNNYHYIIAGLPELAADMNMPQFSYEAVSESIKEQLSDRDRQTVKWLEYSYEGEHLSRHLYRAASRHTSAFIRSYYNLDRRLRNAQAQQVSSGECPYTIGETASIHEEYPELRNILSDTDIFEREFRLDKFRWERISEMTLFHYFDMDVILAFLAKGRIVQRWNRLDKERGRILFKQYVDEVRGTFQGIDFK